MSESSAPVLSAYSITRGWAANSHHRHGDRALKYRFWSSSRIFWILTKSRPSSVRIVARGNGRKRERAEAPTLGRASTAPPLRPRWPPELPLEGEGCAQAAERPHQSSHPPKPPPPPLPGAGARGHLRGAEHLEETRPVALAEPPGSTQAVRANRGAACKHSRLAAALANRNHPPAWPAAHSGQTGRRC